MARSLFSAVFTAALLCASPLAFAQASTSAPLKPNPAAGRTFVYTCAGCHGVPGYQNAYPNYHVPRIAGQNDKYIKDALHEYKDGKREYPTMRAQAEGMTDQDIVNIAAYLSSLRPAGYINPKKPLPSQAKKLAAIQKAADKLPGAKKSVTCQACHGKHGVSISPQYPNLAGQYPDYIVQVLHEYKDGERQNAIMKGMASQLSDTDMRQIAAYFAAQSPVLDTLKGHIQGD